MDGVSPTKYVWGGNKHWAIFNKHTGSLSLVSGLVGASAGCVKACVEEDTFLNKIFGFIQSAAYGIRNHFQYSIYSRKDDDDLGEDLHKRPHAANVGEVACEIEKKINPFLLPLSSLFNKDIRDGYQSIAHLANALWWRIRFCSEKIKWSLLNRNLIDKFKSLFDQDIEERKQATNEIRTAITPLFGLIGAGAVGLFTPIKAFLEFIGTESKLINFFANIGAATQHAIYFFKFTLPELWNAQEKESKDSKLLSTIGLGANSMNIALPVIDALPFNTGALSVAQKLFREVATGFTVTFFSTRRNILGRQWLKKNGLK